MNTHNTHNTHTGRHLPTTDDRDSREATQAEIATANEHASSNANNTDMNGNNPQPYSDGLVMNEALEAVGEELGQFKAYDSQLPITEITGTRIVKCLYQVSPKTGVKAQENSYVRIPEKHLTEEFVVSRIAELSPYIVHYLQGVEDLMIKESHKLGQLKVYTEYLSIDKLIEKLEEQEAGTRLNKDKIEAWFTSDLADALTVLFADKLQLTDDSPEADLQKLELVLEAYKKKFASLASGKTFIKEEDCIAMIGVIETCEAESSIIGSRFIARLEKMQKKEDDLLLSL